MRTVTDLKAEIRFTARIRQQDVRTQYITSVKKSHVFVLVVNCRRGNTLSKTPRFPTLTDGCLLFLIQTREQFLEVLYVSLDRRGVGGCVCELEICLESSDPFAIRMIFIL